jgi:hypothetical protein
MSKIQLREPLPRVATGRRPLMPLDRAILEVAQEPLRPVQIAQALRSPHPGRSFDGWPEISTQRVASRLKSLVQRGLAIRFKPPGAPRNGPGTSLYRVRREEDAQGDG